MHPRALLRMAQIVTVSFAVCIVVPGCGKNQKQVPAKTPQVTKEMSTPADTADIFKEFYSEDTAKKKAGKQETFSPSASSSSFQPEFSANGRYTVQITCVRSKSFAGGMTEKMKDKGYPAYVAEVQNPTPNLSGVFYRVRIGGFGGLSAAKSFGENILTPSGYEYWIDKKSNDNVGMEGYGLGSGSAGSNAASSYDNAPAAGSTSTYQPASSSSYEGSSTTSSYSSPSSTVPPSSSNESTSSSSSSTSYQSPATTTGSSSPAPAASTSPSSTPSGSSTSSSGSTTNKASTGGSTESGWGTDSASKSGW
jgi:hypothetical protein